MRSFFFIFICVIILVLSSVSAGAINLEEYNLDVKGFIDVQHGFDNNVMLNADREKDGYIQNLANIDVTHRTFDVLNIKAGYNTFSTLYYINNINNLIINAPSIGFDWTPISNLTSRNRLIYTHFYSNVDGNNFSDIAFSTDLKHKILKNLYHEGGYKYSQRWYPHRKILITSTSPASRGSAIGNEDRRDVSHSVKYALGLYLKRAFIRVQNEYSVNDSNYKYQEYYDYWTYKLKPSVMYFFTKKFYTDVGFTYKHTRYKDRRGIDPSDIGRRVRSNLASLSTTLYYDITKNITLEVSYTYNENLSKDPFLDYSASTVTGGFNYRF